MARQTPAPQKSSFGSAHSYFNLTTIISGVIVLIAGLIFTAQKAHSQALEELTPQQRFERYQQQEKEAQKTLENTAKERVKKSYKPEAYQPPKKAPSSTGTNPPKPVHNYDPRYDPNYRAPQAAPQTDAYRPGAPVKRAPAKRAPVTPPPQTQQQARPLPPAYQRNSQDYDSYDRAPRQYDRAPQTYDRAPRNAPPPQDPNVYSDSEIVNAGHGFFGAISKSMAKAIEKLFRSQGRPTGYILGEEAGGAFVAGLRYGEGTLYTKNAGTHRIFWQGPSIGYDFGASGSKTMILVYNLRHIRHAYGHFGGVNGSAYLIGGVGVTLLKRGRVTMAPIRSGVGLRFGANVGYLKFTQRPTWNPF